MKENKMNVYQKRFWQEWLLDEESDKYNIWNIFNISGRLDEKRLIESVNKLIDHYSAFRFNCYEKNGEVFYSDNVREKAAVDFIDLHQLKTEDRAAQRNRIIDRYVREPYNLEKFPLYRHCLIKLSAKKYTFVLCFHHILSDGYTLKAIIKIISAYYNNESALSSYTDMSSNGLRSIDLDADKNRREITGEYWVSKFADINPYFNFGYHINRSKKCGIYRHLSLGEARAKRFKKWCEALNTTPFCALMSIYSRLLSRYFCEENFVILYSVNMRNKSCKNMLGSYVNNVPFIFKVVDEKESFQKNIQSVVATRATDKLHQTILLSDLVEKLRATRKISSGHIFNVSFDETYMKLDPLFLRGLDVTVEKETERDIIGDWNLSHELVYNQLYLRLHYLSESFSSAFVDRFLDAFVRLFDAVLSNHEQNMFSFDIVSDADWKKYIKNINSNVDVYPKQEMLHQLFEKQARFSPNAIAVQEDQGALTYYELNESANRVACVLRQQGVRENSIVGVLLPKSTNILVALLGILKAGGAYLPLDIDYPFDRLQFMMNDSGSKWLITEAEFEKKGKELSEKMFIIDELINGRSMEGENLDLLINNKRLAYVIYTSGSTGKPKGVMINHENIVARAYSLADIYGVNENHRHLHLSSFSFDASLEELFLPIIKGGMVIIPPRGANIDMLLLIQAIDKHQVSCVNFVPSLLALFLDEVEQNCQQQYCNSLKTIIAGGEALTSELVNRCHKNFSAKLFNTHGPTENTIDSTYYCFDSHFQYTDIPIGKPLPNSSVYVLNSKRQIVPIGMPGELYVGGVGVSPGYFNRQELTREKFISNPFSAEEEKLYKTGDLVRFLEDGNLIFLSRIDNQVKLRGMRIELGEIESRLRYYKPIKQTVVCVKKLNGSDTLVAYYTSNEVIVNKDLLDYLRKNLPVYMIPSFYVQVDSFPLLPNDKLNYDALPLPQAAIVENLSQQKTAEEQIIFDVWSEILGMKSIGLNDNFFSLGGNSLKGAQVIARIRQKIKKHMPVQYIFDYPTISELAAVVYDMDNSLLKNLSFIKDHYVAKRIPLSHMQERLWFIFSSGAPANVYNIPLVIKFEGSLKIKKLENAINKIIARHSVYRTSFVIEDNGVYQMIHDNAVIRVMQHMACDEKSENHFIHQLIKQDFDFNRAPLLKVDLIVSPNNYDTLVINFHHIIADGWTIDLFIEELNFYYNDTAADTLKLNNIPHQYYDYINWFSQQDASSCKTFWKQYLSNDLELMNFPVDKQRAASDISKGNTIEFMIPEDIGELVYLFAHQHGVTPFIIFLSVFQMFVHFYTRQNKIVVGTVMANRSMHELEDVHGFFANTLPLYCEINPDDSFESFLKKNAQTLSRVFSNQDVSLAEILKSISLGEGISKDLLFSLMFVFQNIHNKTLQLNGLKTLSADIKTSGSKFDFTMVMEEVSSHCFRGRIEFNSCMFMQKTISRYAREFIYLIRQVIFDPCRVITKYSLLLPESKKYLQTLNNTYKDLGRDEWLFQQFDRNSKLFPEKKAVVDHKKSLSYGLLYQQSNKMANFLLQSGVQRNDFIAIYCKKCCEQVISVLATNKAGCPYIPLSTNDPEERLFGVLSESKARYVLVQQEFKDKISWPEAVQVFVIEAVLEGSCITTSPSLIQRPSDLAYVIYTSGSTGVPKGVMIDHAGALNTIRDINSRFNIEQNDSIFALSSLNFDLSVYDIFGVLSAGATLIIPDEDEAKEPAAWLEMFFKHRISIWNSVPAFMQMFCEYLQSFSDLSKYSEYLRSLRLVLLSGDWIPVDLPQKITHLFEKNIQIISLGGATEASIWSILYPIKKTDNHWTSIPYGKPMWNQRFYIFDSTMSIVPMGAVGDLYIGGKGVAKGYLNDRILTEASFVKHPETGEIIYKTGDMGRYQADGNIEFLGRKDFQVKINGFRVELGEIEAKLNKHDLINRSLVLFDHDLKQVIAYFIAEQSNIEVQIIEDYMRQVLPYYMLPGKYIEIEKFPLSANGKVDKKLLPKPERQNIPEKIRPARLLELQIAEIWKSLLQLSEIFLCDNFFALGGHSLIATQLISKIRSIFNIEISIRDIFLHPTLKVFSEHLTTLLSNHNNNKQNQIESDIVEGVL